MIYPFRDYIFNLENIVAISNVHSNIHVYQFHKTFNNDIYLNAATTVRKRQYSFCGNYSKNRTIDFFANIITYSQYYY